MGHIGVKSLRKAVDSLTFDNCSLSSCLICSKANIKHFPFPQKASHHATQLLEHIHSDICGPLPPCYGNYRYFILFIDCFSRFTSLFLMKTRDEAPDLFMTFRSKAETFTGHKIRLLRVDNAPELMKGHFQTACASHGISYEKTVPDSPNQNGVAERSNLTLASMAWAMLLDANLSPWFWPFAIQTAVHIKNRVPHSNLPPHTTPYQLWYHEKPNLGYFHLFGSDCTSRILSNMLTKFDARGESGQFLGYANDAKGYIIWTPGPRGQAGSVKVRHDVHFHGLPLAPVEHADELKHATTIPSLARNDHDLTPPLDEVVDRNTSHFDFENAYAFSSSNSLDFPHLLYLSDIHPSTVVPHNSSSSSGDLADRSHSDDYMYGSYTFICTSHVPYFCRF